MPGVCPQEMPRFVFLFLRDFQQDHGGVYTVKADYFLGGGALRFPWTFGLLVICLFPVESCFLDEK